MGSERVSRTAESHGLGAHRESYRFNGIAWFVMALWPLMIVVIWAVAAGAISWVGVAVGVILGLPAAAVGAAVRANKAVHVFDQGFVLTGMWGQVKQIGSRPEVSVWIKRVILQWFGPPLCVYGVSVAGTKSFGFAARQIVGGGPALARALVWGGLSGGLGASLRTLDETGSVVFGPIQVTREHVGMDAHGDGPAVGMPIDRIRRVWFRTIQSSGGPPAVGELHVGAGKDRAGYVTLRCPPDDLVTAAELIASLAGRRVN
ncbi:hypothetical protein [Kitasatospora sp. MAP5-34]|uniref:hypothetical protein n=1 Tax=Kitasatospora sp. MAP5-34 TaxID=3035102 RepID=UPI00247490FC|nr:hypothetical protein [Kitasatospora sp. MAP5-34]MDH6579927.1 hypothetical protein [Kitasatospora sp. MAP5-34]